jgi:hypothetical protein
MDGATVMVECVVLAAFVIGIIAVIKDDESY